MKLPATFVKKPDKDTWGKLKHVLKYLKGTQNLNLTLSIGDMLVVQSWVDASYSVYEDCEVHMVTRIYLYKGAVSSFSTKKDKREELNIE